MITVRQTAKEYIDDVRMNSSDGYANWLNRLNYFCDYIDRVAGVDLSIKSLTLQHGKGILLDLQTREVQICRSPASQSPE